MRPFPGRNGTEEIKNYETIENLKLSLLKSPTRNRKHFWNFNCTLGNISKADSGNCC